MKTLFLHIGTPKTGTTSIQHFCHDNQDKLMQEGYYYPDFPFKYPGKGNNRNGLFLGGICYNRDGSRNHEQEKENLNEGLKLLNQHFQIYDNIILSDEGIWLRMFCERPNKDFTKILINDARINDYQIKVIVYLRCQNELLLSWYNQMIKHTTSNKRSTLTWEQYYNKYNKYIALDYYNCLEELSDLFGQNNIVVHRFNKNKLTNGALQSDFLSILGLALTRDFIVNEESEHLNTRISENACEIKRIINEIKDINFKEKHRIEDALREISAMAPDNKTRFMSHEETMTFLDGFAQGNDIIADQYIGDDRPLFEIPDTQSTKWERNHEHFENDFIKFSYLLNRQLMEDIARQNKEIKRLNSEIRKLNTTISNTTSYVKHPFRYIFRKIKGKLKVILIP